MKFLSLLFVVIFTVSCASTQQAVVSEVKKEVTRDTIEVCHGTSPRHMICHEAIY